MTRNEFMEETKKKINDILINERNEFLSLINKAWEEGKKSAETEAIESKANDILEAIRKLISDAAEASKIYINLPRIDKLAPYKPLDDPGSKGAYSDTDHALETSSYMVDRQLY